LEQRKSDDLLIEV